jgi:hypothetical protein
MVLRARIVPPFLVFVLLACPVVQAQDGAYTAPADLDILVQRASTIVRGQVLSAKVEPHPQFPNLRTLVVTLSIIKVLKGEAASTLTFRQFLWDANDSSVFAGYKQSGELLLFLNPVSPYGLTSPVGLEQGRFRILRDANGKGYALNGRGNLGLFNQVVSKANARGITLPTHVRNMLAKPSGSAPLDLLETAIQALVGASR